MKYSTWICLIFITSSFGNCQQLIDTIKIEIIGSFDSNWLINWEEKSFTENHTKYVVEEINGKKVLKITSENSASGLWRKLNIKSFNNLNISWEWKVDKVFSIPNEQLKEGDDYPLRLFVIFDPPSFFGLFQGKTLCYVWSSKEQLGNVYPSPVSKGVGTIVAEQGIINQRKWVTENHNLLNDYKRYFGGSPNKIAGFAIMSDSDATGSKTIAWLDNVNIQIIK